MAYLHGGSIVAEALARAGVTHVFTLCGGHVQNIYDGCIDYNIRVVDVRHEQTAAHAADGWARVTGEPGVALVTAGPGLTDAVTGVANARRANVPMIIIGGQAPRMFQDMGGLQDMNHVELMRPITKWAVSVPDTARLGEYVQTAFRIATTGVPGPVYLEMPLDILMNSVDEKSVVRYDDYRTRYGAAPDSDAIAEAVALIGAARKPVLILGSQWWFSRHKEGLHSFLKRAPMPVFVNGMARGALMPDHPCLFVQCRSRAVAEADLVVLFGTPLDFRLGYGREPKFNPDVKVIQVDLDGGEMGRNRGIDVAIPGDTGLTLEAMAEAMERSWDWSSWVAEIATWEAAMWAPIEAEMEVESAPVNPLRACREIRDFLKPDAIVVGDGGDFLGTAAKILRMGSPGSWMDPGPLGTLGVGPGYAIAAKLARPESDVVIVYGDGSFGLHAMEFEAMARQNIKVIGIIGNDAAWMQIRRGQVMMFGEERAITTSLEYTRYEKVVEALGCHGEWVDDSADLQGAFERAWSTDKPALINIKLAASDFRKNAISV